MKDEELRLNQRKLGRIDLDKGQLTLPFTQNQFRDFISGLFGKTERIKRLVEGNFEVEIGDIRSLYFLLQERIDQQNKGILVQFSTKIFYDDDSSIEIPSLEKISNYVEPRAVSPKRIELSWQYLIAFPDSEAPQKQEILVCMTTDSLRMYRDSEGSKSRFPYMEDIDVAGFFIQINYSSRTWATDIDSMITSYLKNLIKMLPRRNVLSHYVTFFGDAISFFSGFVFFLTSLFSIARMEYKANDLRADEIITALAKISDTDKIQFLVDNFIRNELNSSVAHYVLMIALVFLLSIAICRLIDSAVSVNTEQSYILLTRKAQQERNIAIKAQKNQMVKLILSLVLSIGINILSSYIFMHIPLGSPK